MRFGIDLDGVALNGFLSPNGFQCAKRIRRVHGLRESGLQNYPG